MAKEMRFVNRPDTLDGLRVVDDGEDILQALQNGETVMHWEFGNSMFPYLKSGEYCKIRPIASIDEVNIGDAVFCTFRGAYHMVHQCTNKYERDGHVYCQISTTSGTVYGWTDEVWGIAESTNVFQEWTAEMQAALEETKHQEAN
jgi:hypothetical protein